MNVGGQQGARARWGVRAAVNAQLEEISFRTGLIAAAVGIAALLAIAAAGVYAATSGQGRPVAGAADSLRAGSTHRAPHEAASSLLPSAPAPTPTASQPTARQSTRPTTGSQPTAVRQPQAASDSGPAASQPGAGNFGWPSRYNHGPNYGKPGFGGYGAGYGAGHNGFGMRGPGARAGLSLQRMTFPGRVR